MNNSNTTCDYLQEKIRIASVEQNRKSTLLMNLMFPKDDHHSRTPPHSDDNSDDNM